MTRKPLDQKTNRRDFLRDLAVVGGVATVSGGASLAATRPVASEAAKTADTPTGYQVTSHVTKYYEKARI